MTNPDTSDIEKSPIPLYYYVTYYGVFGLCLCGRFPLRLFVRRRNMSYDIQLQSPTTTHQAAPFIGLALNPLPHPPSPFPPIITPGESSVRPGVGESQRWRWKRGRQDRQARKVPNVLTTHQASSSTNQKQNALSRDPHILLAITHSVQAPKRRREQKTTCARSARWTSRTNQDTVRTRSSLRS